MKPEPWWGNDQINQAHYFASVSATRKGSKSACGETFHLMRSAWTRLDTRTGMPWKKCEACMCAMRTARDTVHSGGHMRNLLADVWEREMAGMRAQASRDLAVYDLMLDENDNIVPMPPDLVGLIDMGFAIRERYAQTGSDDHG